VNKTETYIFLRDLKQVRKLVDDGAGDLLDSAMSILDELVKQLSEELKKMTIKKP
jgi:hypothetical protein